MYPTIPHQGHLPEVDYGEVMDYGEVLWRSGEQVDIRLE